MLEAIERIRRQGDKGREAFDHDELVQTWIVHHLQILGEAAARFVTRNCARERPFPGTRSSACGTFWCMRIFRSTVRRSGGSSSVTWGHSRPRSPTAAVRVHGSTFGPHGEHEQAGAMGRTGASQSASTSRARATPRSCAPRLASARARARCSIEASVRRATHLRQGCCELVQRRCRGKGMMLGIEFGPLPEPEAQEPEAARGLCAHGGGEPWPVLPADPGAAVRPPPHPGPGRGPRHAGDQALAAAGGERADVDWIETGLEDVVRAAHSLGAVWDLGRTLASHAVRARTAA